jgi:hypothetical protein
LARRNWRLALPDEAHVTAETKNFFLVGNVGKETLTEMGSLAEQQATSIAKMFRADEGAPLVKGRVTLFAFKRRTDYSEWKMVEGREMPRESRGHWKYNVVDAYGCFVLPSGSEYSPTPLVAQQIAAVYVASLGRVPVWFADGAGRVVASRVEARDASVRQWDDQAKAALARRWNADDFLSAKLPPEQQQLINYAFVKTLATSNAQKYQSLFFNLGQGANFDEAFARAFGTTPQVALASWAGRPPTYRPAVARPQPRRAR